MLLNHDNDDDEETFGEYVESTNQLRRLRVRRDAEKKDSMEMTAKMFFPLILMDISMTHFLVTQQMFFHDSHI